MFLFTTVLKVELNHLESEAKQKWGESMFAVPYPEETAIIQITHGEEVLTEVTPTTKLLHDAIDLIPNYGFINNPEQRRNALHNKIDAVEKMLKGKNKQGVRNKLEMDIKDKLEKWLITYEKENVLQYSKEEIIELVNDLIRQLS